MKATKCQHPTWSRESLWSPSDHLGACMACDEGSFAEIGRKNAQYQLTESQARVVEAGGEFPWFDYNAEAQMCEDLHVEGLKGLHTADCACSGCQDRREGVTYLQYLSGTIHVIDTSHCPTHCMEVPF